MARKIQQAGATRALSAMAKRDAQCQGIPFAMAKGIAPRSSEIGIKDKMAVKNRMVAVLMGLWAYHSEAGYTPASVRLVSLAIATSRSSR